MASNYRNRLASVTTDQHTRYHLVDENDPPLSGQIRRYWTEIGSGFPGVGTPWSAVFVSWCVKRAGATDQEFRFSPRHSIFVHWAIRNATNNTGLFRGFNIADYAPQIGDIIQNNRDGNSYDFNFARNNAQYDSHSAIVVETGQDPNGRYALTIGGNESDSVRRKIVRLKPDGKIKQRTTSPFISVIQTLK